MFMLSACSSATNIQVGNGKAPTSAYLKRAVACDRSIQAMKLVFNPSVDPFEGVNITAIKEGSTKAVTLAQGKAVTFINKSKSLSIRDNELAQSYPGLKNAYKTANKYGETRGNQMLSYVQEVKTNGYVSSTTRTRYEKKLHYFYWKLNSELRNTCNSKNNLWSF